MSDAAGRRLETPSRQTLLGYYAQTEAMCRAILFLEIAVGALALYWILFHAPRPFGIFPVVAFGIGFGGMFYWLFTHIFMSKKRLEEVRIDAKFGEHTRDSLVALANRVFARLGLKRDAVPVFLTRNKDVNAFAVRCELWPGMHLFNGVYLNRSIIHLLDDRELASIIGHELGHVIPYAPLLSRCYLIHATVAGLLCFALAATFAYPSVVFVGPLMVLGLLHWLIALPHMRLSRGIEFLCDDFGAQAAGLLPSLSTEFKMGAESETRQQLMLRLLESQQQGCKMRLDELVEAYEEAVPFGKADPAQFEQELQRISTQKKAEAGKISLGGFVRDLTGSSVDVDEFAEEQIKTLKAVAKVPALPVVREPYLQGSSAWTLNLAEQLVTSIERGPQSVLFQLEHEIDDRGASHPNPSRRILYLWRNRSAFPLQ